MTTSNPFKFGSVVDDPYFTNRVKELQEVKRLLQSQNHLILISPRRYGKTSLLLKAVHALDRPYVFLDIQLVTGVSDFASQLLKRIYRIYPFEHLKQLIKHFSILPALNVNPLTNEVDISFQPVEKANPLLTDIFNLLENLGKKGKRPIVILDEFQDIFKLAPDLDKQLRAVIQHHNHVNYAFLGSMESMMRDIFEKKKSSFYHFGQLMILDKIPYEDFYNYLMKGFDKKCPQKETLCNKILAFTKQHPYYTQQLAYTLWEDCKNDMHADRLFKLTIEKLIKMHDVDYERLWQTFNQTDKKLMILLSTVQNVNILSEKIMRKHNLPAASTMYSSIKRLIKQGYIVKTNAKYELDDPFFTEWIKRKREE